MSWIDEIDWIFEDGIYDEDDLDVHEIEDEIEDEEKIEYMMTKKMKKKMR